MANDEEELAKIIVEPGAVPGSLRHAMSENGGQSQSPAEPERAATQLPEAALSVPQTCKTRRRSQFPRERTLLTRYVQ